jgi:hypothetical protein
LLFENTPKDVALVDPCFSLLNTASNAPLQDQNLEIKLLKISRHWYFPIQEGTLLLKKLPISASLAWLVAGGSEACEFAGYPKYMTFQGSDSDDCREMENEFLLLLAGIMP